MRSLLPFLVLVFSRARRIFSIRLFAGFWLISLAIFLALYFETNFNQFIPDPWRSGLASAGFYCLAFLLVVPILNRLSNALEHLVIRIYLKGSSPDEKVVLTSFIGDNRMIDVPVDYQSLAVQSLVKMGIITPGSGILYPKGDQNPKSYAYYSMPTWIFHFLKANPSFLKTMEPNAEEQVSGP